MRKLFIFIIILFLFFGCQFRYREAWDYTFDIDDLGLETIEEVMVWVSEYVSYHSDSIHDRDEYWQTPYQTYIWRTGDCEDFAILAMYLIYRDVGLIPGLVIGSDGKTAHGWVIVLGEHWEPQSGKQVDCKNSYPNQTIVSYEEVMWRAVNRHKAIEG